MKKQILVLNNPTQFDLADERHTENFNDQVDISWLHRSDVISAPETVLATLPSPNILVTALVELDHNFLQKQTHLEAIIAASTATDYIDLAYCQENNISVFNTPGYTGASVAEHAFSLAMSCTKHLRTADASLRTSPSKKVLPSMELSGKRMGIIGLGNIGSQVAQFAKSFNMDVVYSNRSKKDFAGAHQVALDELLTTSDVVVMTVPLNQHTHHLIGQRELKLMKQSAFLVNIGADELIDIDQLVNALKNSDIAGAALDVITEYQAYLDAPNLILTQSRGWYTDESVNRRMTGWLTTLNAYLDNDYINKII